MSLKDSFADAGLLLLTDIDDISTLWTDLARTTNATVGDTVKVIDLVDNVITAYLTNPAGFVLRQDGDGRHYLESNGTTNSYFQLDSAPVVSGLRSVAIAYQDDGSADYTPFYGQGNADYAFHGNTGTALLDATYAHAYASGGSWVKDGSSFDPTSSGSRPTSAPAVITCVCSAALPDHYGAIIQDRSFTARRLNGKLYDIALSTTAWDSTDIAIIHSTMLDGSGAGSPTYTITPDVTSVDEGDVVTFTVNAPDGTYGYRLTESSTANGADVGMSSTWGEVIVSSGVGTIALTITADAATEGEEAFALELWDAPWPGETELLATSATVTINDTSNSTGVDYTVDITGGTGEFVSGDYVVNEGGNFTISVTASVMPPSGKLYYRLDPFNLDDFADGGDEITLTSDGLGGGYGSAVVNVVADGETEGTETYSLKIYLDGNDEHLAVTGPDVVVIDTSQAAPTYAVVAGAVSRAEGLSVTMYVDTTTVEPGTILYWTPSAAGTITADDISPASGSVAVTGTIVAGEAEFVVTFIEDLLTEGEETWAVDIRTGSLAGPIVATSDPIPIEDTSLTPPTYAIEQDKTTVPEGGSVTFDITTEWFTGSTLYYTLSGSANGSDFDTGISGSISVTETVYPEKTGSKVITLSIDETIEGTESFTFQLRTGSTSGPIVATAAAVTILDEVYTVTVDKRIVTEGQSVTFTITGENSNPSETFDWEIIGSVSSDDFTDPAMSGSISLSGGVATLVKTLLGDSTADGAEHFYLLIKRSGSGAILAASPAVLVRDAYIDFDEWLDDINARRIVLVEMQHSAGWIYFGNYPYQSYPDDSNPNRPYDDLLADMISIEQRMDGALTVGEINIQHTGEHNDWINYDWRGFTVRILMGHHTWRLDDFRLVALCVNGGLATVERGSMGWAIYDAKAKFAAPLQTSFLNDGNPVPVSIGKPFNVPAVLIDQPSHRYKVHESSILSVTPRDNGADVSSTDTLASGYFELAANPTGNVAADVVTSFDTPALIVSMICDRYGETADAETIGALPAYDIGLWYNGFASGGDVLQHVAQSIGGYWLVGLDGEVEVYQLTDPELTPDFVLTADDVVLGGLRWLGADEPVKALTMNYKRNWSPVTRDSIAGAVITGDPDFAEALTKEWLQITVENTSADYPLAESLIIDSYLTDSADAATEANRIAGLRSVRRERWQVECFASFARAKVGNTVEIINPRHGFENGRLGVIVAVSLELTRKRVLLEVMIAEETS